ncbi:glycosyltransferase family 2 protein [Sphingobium limneticum]|uniref:glycosyltransferase family 2 protein n=1 Tax=Sphingobium limneticum TaxID=1007511 RepID=UPI00123CD848|nr:glycosyltransferase family 2 protein [Sphingobium limneticum]KAA9013016.1 glycosyltransferase family 2 protein [Sphingobium limneticum]
MHVCVCIVGYRNAPEIQGCLDALSGCDHHDFQVVICENGGSQAYEALVTLLPGSLNGGQPVTILAAPGNLGYAGGVNHCITSASSADAWWIVNPDTRPQSAALGALVERLQRGDCEAAGSLLYHADGKVQAYGGRWKPWMARCESIGHGRNSADPIEADRVEAGMNYLLGASMLMSRQYVEAVGLMREDYFLYAEEVEWCLRGRHLGMRLGFAPGSRVLHGQGGTTGSARAMKQRPRLPIYLDERNKLNVVRDTSPAKLPVAVTLSLAMLFLRFARRGAWKQLGYGLSGWMAGLRNKRGIPHGMG